MGIGVVTPADAGASPSDREAVGLYGAMLAGVDYQPSYLNEPEALFHEHIKIYNSYWRMDPEFDRTNVETMLPHLPCPHVDRALLLKLSRAAIDAGACVVNDISGLRFEPALADIVREAGAGLILMHSRGTPRDMQHDPSYHDVMMEVVAGLGEACRRAEERGVGRNRTVVDPGIGFGKTIGHNLELLRHLDRLVAAGRPVLIGVSRKSFISRILDVGIEDRLEGSLAAAVSAVLSGVHLVRVHDVVATVRAVRVADAIRNGSPTT